MLCIQLLFPTATLPSIWGGWLLSDSLWSLFLSRHLANKPFILEDYFFFFFLNYIKYIRLPGVEKEWPGFWKHEAGPFDSWLEFEAIYHLVLRSRRCSTGWLVCTVQIKNKEQDKHPCCLWISGVVVSLPKCQVCVYTYVCVCMWKLVLLKSEDVLTWCKSKQWRLGKKRKQKSEALF